jgi:hypothetical protein
MDQELSARLDRIEQKVDAAYAASERVRKYLFWTGAVAIALIVLPAIGLVFAVPSFLASYGSIDNINALTQ